MNLFKTSFFTLITSLFFTVSCSTYKAQYKNNWDISKTETSSNDNTISHVFYLIGDAGDAKKNQELTHFKQLKKILALQNKNTTVLFLGDNIYEHGFPNKKNPSRKIAEHKLDAQLNLVTDFKGKTIFIPGNHDYYNYGIKGLQREANYITKKLDAKNSFLPKNGCPISKTNISSSIILVTIDSQWFLENWDNHPTMNDDCFIKTREQFFNEFESIVKKNPTKTILVALHHPMFSNGNHGGQFSLKQQLFPLDSKIPLPVIGSIVNLIRKTSGISPQDLQNKNYQLLKNRLLTLSQNSDKLIFISGHEHNLQYIVDQNKPQIISGSGSKHAAARISKNGLFSYGGLGYAKLVVHNNGVSRVSYFTEKNNKTIRLFQKEIFSKISNKTKSEDYSSPFDNFTKASIYTPKELDKSWLFKKLWGKHYRKYYKSPILAKTGMLDTLYGGLIPIRKGGGHQSKSLQLKTKNGTNYVMRAMHKSATQYLQAVAFKNENIKGKYDATFAERLLLDIYTTAHPYAPFAIGKLSDAIGLFHTNPQLYYIPKQKSLLNFNTDFGNELYLVEEKVTSGNGSVKSFGNAKKIINTSDLLQNLRKSDNTKIDEKLYIRARLFDMLIGDWDRHEDQWKWAEFKDKNLKIYKPIPRDRDQAFSKSDGIILGFITRIIPALKLMQVYNPKIRNVKWFNVEPYPLDKTLIVNATFKNWEDEVTYIQTHLTNNIIDKAFEQLPKEVQDETVDEIKNKLKGRLKELPSIAKKYYKLLSKYEVVKGNDKDNYFKISRLNNNTTNIKIFNIKNHKKGSLFFDKTYSNKLTKEIWVYGMDASDVFEVSGKSKQLIPIKIIGGQNNDIYTIKNGKKVTIYDFKSKKNTFKNLNGTIKLIDNYKLNTYNYKKLKYSQNKLVPLIGGNPDDGFKVGLTNIFTVYGFERSPFTQQHSLKAAYYFDTKGYDILYEAEFASAVKKWNFLISTSFTSPNYTMNFYGLGNETPSFENQFGEDYHRVRLSTYSTYPSLKWIGRFGTELKFGPLIESISVEKTPNRFINTISSISEKRKTYLGAKLAYNYQNYDNKTFPTLGMNTSFETGWKTNTSNNSENNWYITPSISFDYKLTSNGSIVLASKLKGNVIIGSNFEFYNAAIIGGLDGLRGYRNQRFTGNKSFYQNTDIRFNLRTIKTSIVPIQYGIYGGFDYGRIWLKNEKSNNWNTSVGGGFWLIAAKLINLNVSAFNSNEGTYVRFGLGFGF